MHKYKITAEDNFFEPRRKGSSDHLKMDFREKLSIVIAATWPDEQKLISFSNCNNLPTKDAYVLASCLWDFKSSTYLNFVSHLLQLSMDREETEITLPLLILMEKQMGRVWTAEMLLTTGFVSNHLVTSGENVLLNCIRMRKFDLLWQLLEEYDLPVECMDPPYINKTLLHSAVSCALPPHEIKKILALSYNL